MIDSPKVSHRDEFVIHEARVPILGDVIDADDGGIGVAVKLKHVLDEINDDDTSAVAHVTKIEAFDVVTELVLVDHHGREGRGGVEEARVDDEDSDVFKLVVGVGEEVVKGAKHDLLGLFPSGGLEGASRDGVHGLGDVGVFTKAEAEENLALEVKGGGEEVADEGGVVHELAKEDAKVLRGKVARVVQEIDEVGRVMI